MQQECNKHYIALASLDLVGSLGIPRYVRNALGPYKGSWEALAIFPPIFIASLLPPCIKEINS